MVICFSYRMNILLNIFFKVTTYEWNLFNTQICIIDFSRRRPRIGQNQQSQSHSQRETRRSRAIACKWCRNRNCQCPHLPGQSLRVQRELVGATARTGGRGSDAGCVSGNRCDQYGHVSVYWSVSWPARRIRLEFGELRNRDKITLP